MTLVMRQQLQKVLAETRTTTMFVSHDLEEAVQTRRRGPDAYPPSVAHRRLHSCSFARPRAPEIVSEPEFVALKARALDVFQKAVRGSPAAAAG